MRSIRSTVIAWAGSILLGVLGAPTPSLAGAAAWDESAVAKLAQQLVLEVATIKDNLSGTRERADPKSARWVVLDDLMQLQHRAVAFEGLVRAGQGRDNTAPVFQRIRTAVEHARRDAPAFPELQKQREHIDRAEAVLQKLAVYYETD